MSPSKKVSIKTKTPEKPQIGNVEDIEGLGGLWLSGGVMVQLGMDSGATGPYGPEVDVVWDDQFPVVGYWPSDGDVLRVLTTLGNSAADTFH